MKGNTQYTELEGILEDDGEVIGEVVGDNIKNDIKYIIRQTDR